MINVISIIVSLLVIVFLWFLKRFIEEKASMFATRDQADQIMAKQNASAKELEVIKAKLQITSEASGRRGAEKEKRILEFIDHMVTLIHISAIETLPILTAESTRDLEKQAQEMGSSVSLLIREYVRMAVYLNESDGAIVSQAGKCVELSKKLATAFYKVFSSLVGPSAHLRHMKAWSEELRKDLLAKLDNLPGDEMNAENWAEILPHDTALRNALAAHDKALTDYRDTVLRGFREEIEPVLIEVAGAVATLVHLLQPILGVPLANLSTLLNLEDERPS
ncbi:MAG: hypothetical protein C7B47_16720 [Sulfobacillus thermosulfidooxidans]|uniref:Uncharacterized protein n=1 Tax=Sulfobacillus thermosulfidooxidans TaxID=28034 RepID=A0A2T2WJD4_SULTH|nr:MAG: hypothetical protein C7B47_16720 [Sulfobacillus thermosulfidooxidans]